MYRTTPITSHIDNSKPMLTLELNSDNSQLLICIQLTIGLLGFLNTRIVDYIFLQCLGKQGKMVFLLCLNKKNVVELISLL